LCFCCAGFICLTYGCFGNFHINCGNYRFRNLLNYRKL